MNEIYKNYLEHHGILGQKWGRKNGPPYPLSAGAHSAAEKKAGWRKSLDKSGDKDKSSESRSRKAASVNDDSTKDRSRANSTTNTLADFAAKEGYAKNADDALKSIKSTNVKLNKNKDEFIRDAVNGKGYPVLKENPDDHSYIVRVNDVKRGVNALAAIKRDENGNADISVYAREGLIKQDLADKAIDILKDTLEKELKIKHSDQLEHHGILGQKHGVRNGPPYPLSAGAHSAAEKKAGWRQSLGSYMKAKKEKKRQAAVEAHDAAKKDALESGDADKILRFRKELTNNELNDALNRARTVSNLRNETDSNRLRDVKKAMDTVRTIKDAVNLGIDSVETARKLKKTFTPEKKEKPNDFEKSLQNSLEQFGKMSVDELMKTDTMKKLKDTREAGEEYNKLKKAVNKVTDDDDKKKDKK